MSRKAFGMTYLDKNELQRALEFVMPSHAVYPVFCSVYLFASPLPAGVSFDYLRVLHQQ